MKKLVPYGVLCLAMLQSAATFADEAFAMRSGSTVVTVEDVERYLEENVPKDEPRRSQLLSKPGFFHELAESLVVIRSLSKEALDSGLLDERQVAWEARHVHQRALVSKYREAYIQDVFRDMDWDKLAREAYLAEPERYQQAAQVSASHVLITTNGRTDEEALALLADIRTRLEAGEDFGALASEFSEDQSARRNKGALGFFPRGVMDPAFADTAFALEEVGELSEPVKSQFGYHLIRLDGKREAGLKDFETEKENIIGVLKTKWTNELWQDKVIAVRSDKSITLNDEAFDGLAEKYKAAAPSKP